MKPYVSILLFFLLFIFSCTDQNKKASHQQEEISKINRLLEDQSREDLSFDTRKKLIDSAILLSKIEKIDSLELKSLAAKSYLYSLNNKDSVHQLLMDLIQKSNSKKNRYFSAYGYSLLGKNYFEKGRFDSAYYYLNRSNTYYREIDDLNAQVYNLILMATVLIVSNDFIAGEELATQALELNNGNNLSYETELYNLLSFSYKEIKEYDQAIYYLNQSRKHTDDSNPIEDKILEHNIAEAFLKKNQPDTAITILKKVLSEKKIINSNDGLKTNALSNLGYALFLKNKNKGITELIEADRLIDSTHNKKQKQDNYIKISKYYLSNDSQKAIYYLEKAVHMPYEYQKPEDKLEALKLLIQVSPPLVSSVYAKQYVTISDSLADIRQKTKNQFAKIRFDFSKEQEQNLLLKSKTAADELIIQKQKNTNVILGSAMFLLIIISLFSYLYIRDRHLRQRIIENFKTENIIATRIHDELANDVFNTLSYSENKDLSVPEHRKKLLDYLDHIYERTRNFSRENKSIDTSMAFQDLLRNLLSEYNRTGLKITPYGLDQPYWNHLDHLVKMNLYRIIQELLVNMKKHSNATLVMIRFEKAQKKGILRYFDNGVGIDMNKKMQYNGLQNVETRTKAIKGKLTFESEKGKGLKIEITFPL